MTVLIQILQFALALFLLILLHEGGHFFFAKVFGVRVSRFYLFFNPKFHLVSTYDTWVRRLFKMEPEVVPVKEVKEGENTIKKKEYVGTEYGIGWLPLGGYCAIDGMIDETNQTLSKEVKPWEFRAKPAWQRLLIMIGGVLVNFLLALFIYSMVLYTWGERYVPVQNMTEGMYFNEEAKAFGFQNGDIMLSHDGVDFQKLDADFYRDLAEAHEVTVLRGNEKVSIVLPGNLDLLEMLKAEPRFVSNLIPMSIDSVIPGSPAEKAGIVKGDKILSINNHTVNTHNELVYELGHLYDVYAAAEDEKAQQKALTTEVVYLHNADTTKKAVTLMVEKKSLKLGFMPIIPNYQPVTIEYGFFESFPAGVAYGWNVLSGYVGDMKYLFSSEGAKSLGGFGTIGSLFPPVWDWYVFWMMTAFLSIILAFMNILPIPALDGGHVLFLLYEMITRRKPSEQFMIRAEYVGFGILILLMVVANLNDVLRWMGIM